MAGEINELLSVITDTEKHLSHLAKCKVKVTLSFEPDELYTEYQSTTKLDKDVLVEIVCMNFQIPSILVYSRHTAHAQARWAFSVIARNHLGMTLTEIGDFLRRDHTTIIHGITRAQEIMTMERDPFTIKMKKIEQDFLNTTTKSKKEDE